MSSIDERRSFSSEEMTMLEKYGVFEFQVYTASIQGDMQAFEKYLQELVRKKDSLYEDSGCD